MRLKEAKKKKKYNLFHEVSLTRIDQNSIDYFTWMAPTMTSCPTA